MSSTTEMKGAVSSVTCEGRVRVMLIGCGPHATRMHLPYLAESDQVDLVALVEVPAGALKAQAVAQTLTPSPELVVVEPWDGVTMPPEIARRLSEVVQRLRVGAIMIATEPLAHGSYLNWALTTKAHILVDKPIIALADASNSPKVARQLDAELARIARLAAAAPDRLVAVGTQRRYHPAMELALELLADGASRFETPVTSMESSHADGQFRYPHEFETIEYHGYTKGIGKLSHSGYHEYALQADVIQATYEAAGAHVDSFSSYASAVRPAGFLRQIPSRTYQRQFSREAWAKACPEPHAAMTRRMGQLGELDVFSTNTFYIDGEAVLLSSIGLVHTSLSQRSWLPPGDDLYKGNGRVKHEHHDFRLGPFLSVQIHSYQSRDVHDINDEREYGPGGNNHMEVHVFRNTGWCGRRALAHEAFGAAELAVMSGAPHDASFTAFAKQRMLADFFSCATGERPLSAHRSPLASHVLGASMLSAAFESVASKSIVHRSMPIAAVLGGAA